MSSARRSAVRALPTVGERAEVGAPPCRRRCPDPVPVEPGVAWARMMRRSMSSRHCLITSGETASSGGLRSSSLAVANGSLGATCAGALGACSAARCCASWAAALGVGRRERPAAWVSPRPPPSGGHGTQQSEPWRCQVGDQAETKLAPTWRAKCRRISPAGWRIAPA